MRRWSTALALAFIAVLATSPAAPAAGSRTETTVARASAGEIRARVLELVNEARARGGRCGAERFGPAAPLGSSAMLDEAARRHARDMARHGYFDHTARDGSAPKQRLARVGYRSRLTGENIAYGPTSAEEVVRGWLASPGHCANLLEPRFQEMGLALATGDARGAIYWVQVLATPQS